eukprot:4708632-Prymnesium_polylepis.1
MPSSHAGRTVAGVIAVAGAGTRAAVSGRGGRLNESTFTGGTLDTLMPSSSSSFRRSHISLRVNGTTPSARQPRSTFSSANASSQACLAHCNDAVV